MDERPAGQGLCAHSFIEGSQSLEMNGYGRNCGLFTEDLQNLLGLDCLSVGFNNETNLGAVFEKTPDVLDISKERGLSFHYRSWKSFGKEI